MGNMAETQTENRTTSDKSEGIYTISDIDKFTIARIENVKVNYTLNLTTLSSQEMIDQLDDLFSSMLVILEKYFSKELEDYKITTGKTEMNFYQIKHTVDGIRLMNIESLTTPMYLCRKTAELGINVWDYFMRKLGVQIATKKLSQKKN
jgi:hypothetical protein